MPFKSSTSSRNKMVAHRPKTSSTASRSSASIDRAAAPPNDEGGDEEKEIVWKTVKHRAGDCFNNSLVLAVVHPGQEKTTSRFIKDKIAKHNRPTETFRASVRVTTADRLQSCIDGMRDSTTRLIILVCNTVGLIQYNITDAVRNVFVGSCEGATGPGTLRISAESTYCEVPACTWAMRTDQRLLDRYSLTHSEGCHFNGPEAAGYVKKLLMEARVLSTPKAFPLPEADLHEVKSRYDEFQEASMKSAGPDKNQETNEGGSWFQKYKLFIATALGAGVACGGMAGAVWMSTGGIYLSGPWGISISAGYHFGAAMGGAFVTAAGAGILAAGAVYFIPWGTVLSYLEEKLWQIWDLIWGTVKWAWEKIKAFCSKAVEKIPLWVGAR